MTKVCFSFLLLCFFAGGVFAAALPDVPDEAKQALGSTYGTPQMDGFVFVDGRYLPPPYSVTRKGNGIFINRVQIAQPVSWAKFTGETPEPKAGKKDADGDFEEVKEPAEAAAAPQAGTEAKPKGAKSIDDLFDEGDAAPSNTAAATPAKEPAAEAPKPATDGSAIQPSTADLTAAKEQLKANLDKLRLFYEKGLSRNEIFFFSPLHALINGNSGTARTLIDVLPDALREARSPEDLLARLESGGVYFLDLPTVTMIFRNRLTFPQLQERLEKIKLKESIDAMARKSQGVY